MQEIWLPSNTPQSKAVGRFVDRDHEYTDRHGEKHIRTVTVLEHKFPGSQDVSTSLCKDNADGMKLRKEWSQAWALYEKQKAAAVGAPPVPTATEYGIKGTPIEHADFLGKDHIARLKLMGFLTIEQIAGISDAQCQNIGFGANGWRKKAAEFLIVARDEQRTAAPVPVAQGPSPLVAELMSKLDDAVATMAKQAELIATLMAEKSADEAVEPPKPRRGRPSKAAEAQPEA
jgi:hypothetical protein